jgi:hypothetical protein
MIEIETVTATAIGTVTEIGIATEISIEETDAHRPAEGLLEETPLTPEIMSRETLTWVERDETPEMDRRQRVQISLIPLRAARSRIVAVASGAAAEEEIGISAVVEEAIISTTETGENLTDLGVDLASHFVGTEMLFETRGIWTGETTADLTGETTNGAAMTVGRARPICRRELRMRVTWVGLGTLGTQGCQAPL